MRTPPTPKIGRLCLECDTPFMAFPSEIRKGGGRFCSKKCYVASKIIDDVESYFWNKVIKSDDCWEWQGSLRTPNGYGLLGINRRSIERIAHRFSWELHFGPIPDSLCVLHHCDNRLCVRPDHLFIGDRSANAADRHKKERESKGGRHSLVTRGLRNGRAKLSENDILVIRSRYACGGITQDTLAQEYGVKQAYVSRIVLRHAWKHI